MPTIIFYGREIIRSRVTIIGFSLLLNFGDSCLSPWIVLYWIFSHFFISFLTWRISQLSSARSLYKVAAVGKTVWA